MIYSELFIPNCFLWAVSFRQCSTLVFKQQNTKEMCKDYHKNKTCLFFFLHFLWLYVIIMSPTSFRVNLHSIVYLNVKKLLTQSRGHIWSLSDSNGILTHKQFVNEHSTIFVYALWIVTLGLVYQYNLRETLWWCLDFFSKIRDFFMQLWWGELWEIECFWDRSYWLKKIISRVTDMIQ